MPNLTDELAKLIGAAVTIYTASGGQSGGGFGGVLSMVTPEFARLITCAGPPPCCSLGSSCPFVYRGRRRAGGRYGYTKSNRNEPVNNIGSVTDIPLDKIAALVI